MATFSKIWKNADLRKKILFTLMIFVVYRIGSYIPVPTINTSVLEASAQTPMLGYIKWRGIETIFIVCDVYLSLYYCINCYPVASNGCCTDFV